MSAPLTLPRVHLNGTSKRELLEQYTAAYRAVGEALDVVAQNGPNGRDYYVLGDGALVRAQVEHGNRLQKLRDVRIELLAIIDHING